MARKKDYNYYDKFVELVGYCCKSAEILNSSLINFDTKTIENRLQEMHDIEHAADLSKHELMERLAEEFIAPLEREDIASLSQEIDNITDAIEDVLIKINMYNVQAIRPEVLEFSKLITLCCNSLKVALEEFHNYKKSSSLKPKLIEVNDLEEKGDALYYETVYKLYRNNETPVDLLIWTEIYDLLEGCCDACEDVADVIESIVMKNS
jgi:predicted phosphate transport protein (TIGR00153 family)